MIAPAGLFTEVKSVTKGTEKQEHSMGARWGASNLMIAPAGLFTEVKSDTEEPRACPHTKDRQNLTSPMPTKGWMNTCINKCYVNRMTMVHMQEWTHVPYPYYMSKNYIGLGLCHGGLELLGMAAHRGSPSCLPLIASDYDPHWPKQYYSPGSRPGDK